MKKCSIPENVKELTNLYRTVVVVRIYVHYQRRQKHCYFVIFINHGILLIIVIDDQIASKS